MKTNHIVWAAFKYYTYKILGFLWLEVLEEPGMDVEGADDVEGGDLHVSLQHV